MSNNKKQKIGIDVLLGIISSLISIGCFVHDIMLYHSFVFSWKFLVALLSSILFFLIFALRISPSFRYNIKKIIIYYFNLAYLSETVFVEKKEYTYTFKNRTSMAFRKDHTIKSRVVQLSSFTDKFKWSKLQTYDEEISMCEKITANDNDQRVTFNRFENWNCYTINFPGIGKGDTKKVGILLKDLEDPEQTSLLFLSGSAIYKTKEMVLKVVVEDVNLFPGQIEYKIYDNYASPFPIISKTIECKYMGKKKCIEIVETKPIPGYRYVISWKF